MRFFSTLLAQSKFLQVSPKAGAETVKTRAGGGSRIRKPADLLAEIRSSLRDVDTTSREVEKRFVTIGEAFAQQLLLNDDLVAEGERLVRANDAAEGCAEPVAEIIALIQDSVSFVERSAAVAVALADQFARYERQIRGVQAGKERLARTLIPLQIIERLFRIESAALPIAMQQAFESLTQEIGRLYRQMRDTLAEQFDTMAATEARIGQARKRLAEHAVQLTGAISETRSTIDRSLAAIEVESARNRLRSERLGQVTQQLASEVNAVMVGLQYQDILRQKTEHVKEGVDDILGHYQSGSSRPKNSALPLLAQACQLEALQLGSIGEGLDQASSSIAQGIGNISDKLQEIEMECLPFGELKVAIASSETIVKTLVGAMASTRDLVLLTHQGTEEAFMALNSFGGNATNVTSTLARLALDIKLIALNAQIQAAQMGGGTGLEVLSEQTCQLSDETNLYTRAIGDELNQLLAILHDVVSQCRSGKDEAAAQLAKMDQRGGELECGLRSQQSEASSVLSRLADLISKSADCAKAMRASNDFSAISKDAFTHARGLLDELGRLAAEGAGSRASRAPAGEALAKARSRYTMESERMIYESVVGNQKDRPAPRAPVAAVAESSADSNIELF